MATLDEVSELIHDAVAEMGVRVTANLNEIRNQIHRMNSPQVEPYTAVTIYPNIGNNNTSLHLIKSLPEFKGDASEYPPWREAAHFAINYYNEGSENYYIAMGILRNKISGSANVALSSFNTVLNFRAIIERLDQSYSDKRPIHVLESQLSVLRQGNLPIQEYYDSVDRQLTLIVNKIKMNNANSGEVISALNDRARENALRVFISGLRRPLCDILFSSKPRDLMSALAIAQELEFNQKRQDFARAFSANKKGDSPQFSGYQGTNSNIRNINLSNNVRTTNPNSNIRNNNFNSNDRTNSSNSNGRAEKSSYNWRLKQEPPEPMDVDPGSSFFRRHRAQPSNDMQQIPNSERMKSIRRTPFSSQKFQALNHLPVASKDHCEAEEFVEESDDNESSGEFPNTFDQEINFLD